MPFRLPPLHRLAFALLLTAGALWGMPRHAHGDLNVHVLVDRSGSMWAPVAGKAKILTVSEALERMADELPPDVALGLRTYPPPRNAEGEDDAGLRVALGTENRDRFVDELQRLNPQGKAPLPEHLEPALEDFPEAEGTHLLILLTDGADTGGTSFCASRVVSLPPSPPQVEIFSLNLQDERERGELQCLADQMEGRATHIEPGEDLFAAILPITRSAYEREAQRQTRQREEELRRKLLAEKTRLRVTFENILDPFFADSLEVVRFEMDGRPVPLPADKRLRRGEARELLDSPIPQGNHRIVLQYRLWRGEQTVTSREATLQVDVERGKTTAVRCYPQGGLFHWGSTFTTSTRAEPS